MSSILYSDSCISTVFGDRLLKCFILTLPLSMKENPLFATQTGDHRYNDKLGGKSEEDHDRRIKQFEMLMEQLSEIDHSDFQEGDKLNYEIFDRYLKNEFNC